MRRVLWVTAVAALLATTAQADTLGIRYTLRIENGDTGVAHVTAAISGVEGEGLLLERNDAGGGWFDGVTARDTSGAALRVAEVEEGYYVTTGGGGRVTVDYSIKPGVIGQYGHLGLITADWAALDGGFVFLAPGEEHAIESVQLAVEMPQTWQAVTSWVKASGTYRPDETLAPVRMQLARGLLCFGDFRRRSKGFGTNTLNVWVGGSYSEEGRERLSGSVEKVYGATYELLGFETGKQYNVVCIPAAPDGLPVVAGAWVDGVALTLAGKLKAEDALRYAKRLGRFVMGSYFAEGPSGVRLSREDWWVYPAVLTYAEGLAARETGFIGENVFYSDIYTGYAVEASSDFSRVDVAFGEVEEADAEARSFLSRVKAVLLLMRLDFEIRVTSRGTKRVEDLIRALFERGGEQEQSVLETLGEVTGADFEAFYESFVRSRTLILPTWPGFMESLKQQAEEGPGKTALTVQGAPIFEREVEILVNELRSEGRVREEKAIRETALAILVDERLLDKGLAERRTNVVPEAFWRLRGSLPARVMRLVITRKRQALKNMLFEEWLANERQAARRELKEEGAR